MSMKYRPQCIKCKTAYDSDDVEPYYCPPCNEQRLAIAKEIDSKVIPPKRARKSELQVYDELGGGKYVNIRDLGISL